MTLRHAGTLVVAAMPGELRPFVRAAKLRREAIAGLRAWGDGEIVAAAVGVGAQRAVAGVARAFEVIDAERMLVVGVAGSTGVALHVGDLVVPASVIDARTDQTYVPSGFIGLAHSGTLSSVLGLGTRGDIAPGVLAVDMETAALAGWCTANGVPWDVLRTVSDVVGTVTAQVADVLGSDGRPQVKKLASLVGRDPGKLPHLVRIGLDFRRAVTSLTATLCDELARGGSADGCRRAVPPPQP